MTQDKPQGAAPVRPCDCDVCYCGNKDDARRVAEWDADQRHATALIEAERRGMMRAAEIAERCVDENVDMGFIVMAAGADKCVAAIREAASSPAPVVTVEMLTALAPFDAAVFNDNGEVTISTGHIKQSDWLKLSAAIAQMKEKP